MKRPYRFASRLDIKVSDAAVESNRKPIPGSGRRVLFMPVDDADAAVQVSGIFAKVGLATVDLGTLASGGKLHQVPGGLLTNLNLIKLG